MTVEEAISKFKTDHPDLVILSCNEYESRFVFHAVPSEYVGTEQENMAFDSLYSVHKKNGEITPFTPLDITEEEYDSGKNVYIDKMNYKITEISKTERDTAIEWLSRHGFEI